MGCVVKARPFIQVILIGGVDILAVALNYLGMTEDRTFGPMLVKLFDDFKVVKLNPYDDVNQGALQLCQPEEYQEMIKHIKMEWDATETFLELSGLRLKLQRAVRQMFFFDQEKKYERVLLDGCRGIDDFPWAMQVLIIHLPVLDRDLSRSLLKKADIVVIDDSRAEASAYLVARVKMLCSNVPVVVERLQSGLSSGLKHSLEDVFAVYLARRQRIKAMLTENCPEPLISCEQARQMAAKLRVSTFLFGNVCDECGYSITHCGFGCF